MNEETYKEINSQPSSLCFAEGYRKARIRQGTERQERITASRFIPGHGRITALLLDIDLPKSVMNNGIQKIIPAETSEKWN
jgi:hypothetical protein